MKKILCLTMIAAALSGCSGFFDKDNTPPPTPLSEFAPEVRPTALWYTSTGYGAGKDLLKLTPAVTEQSIYTTNNNGAVTAVDRSTGKIQWRSQTGTLLSSGTAADNGLVFVGGLDGTLIALSQKDGSIAWKNKVSTEVLAPPAAANNVVVVKAIDGKVTGFSQTDGHVLWNYQQTEPALILRGASTPQLSRDTTVIGFANGNLAKLNLQDGRQYWLKTVAVPEGIFSIQRMVDIDADPVIFRNKIYVATYQGKIAALDLSSGETLWSDDISAYSGIAADEQQVYVSDITSRVTAYSSESGAIAWRQAKLKARSVTGPAVMGRYIVVGDLEGYLHFLSRDDGRFVGRVRVSRSPILAAPVVSNGTLYVVTKDGHLAAYTLS
jgi:outer membrane protein assembly factor BamB